MFITCRFKQVCDYLLFIICYYGWFEFTSCFACSLSALIDNKVFCVHGGLSPTISTLDQVNALMEMVCKAESNKPCNFTQQLAVIALSTAECGLDMPCALPTLHDCMC